MRVGSDLPVVAFLQQNTRDPRDSCCVSATHPQHVWEIPENRFDGDDSSYVTTALRVELRQTLGRFCKGMKTMRTRIRTESAAQNRDRRGAIAVLIVVCLPVLLFFAAFAVDVAWMQLVRSELRVATDAAARAGGRTLSLSQDVGAARAAAIEAASRNEVGNRLLELRETDVVFGRSEQNGGSRYQFSPTSDVELMNAVRVDGRRTQGSISGPVPLMFRAIPNHQDFEPQQSAISTQLVRDVALVLDRSGSMTRTAAGEPNRNWQPGGPAPADCRWRDLADAVDIFLAVLEESVQDEQVSLSTYATSATLDYQLSDDYTNISNAMDGMSGEYYGGWTAIGEGMREGMKTFENPDTVRPLAARTMIVLTDGRHNTGVDPRTVAADIADEGVTIHTITFSDEAEEWRMEQTAEIGGGKHWHASDAASLREAFIEIARDLPTLLTE